MANFKTVKLDEIFIPESVTEGISRERKEDEDSILSLAADIEERGLDFPIITYDIDGELQLGDGLGRLLAHKNILKAANGESVVFDKDTGDTLTGKIKGKKYDGTILVKVKVSSSEEERRMEGALTNMHRKKSNAAEMIGAIEQYMTTNNIHDTKKIAKKFKLTAKTMGALLKTIRVKDDAFKEEVQEGKIPLNKATLFPKLQSVCDEEEWNEFVDLSKNKDINFLDFSTKVEEFIRIKKEEQIAGKKKQEGFVPKPKVRKKDVLLAVLNNLEEPSNDQELGYKNGIRYALSLDDETLKKGEDEYNRKKELASQKKEAAKQKSEDKKIVDAILKGYENGTIKDVEGLNLSSEMKDYFEQGKKIIDQSK